MTSEQIKDSIKQLAYTGDEVFSILCKVLSVDTVNKTCDCEPLDGKADIIGVRLMADNKTGFLIIPKKDSIVCVSMLNNFTGIAVMFSEIDEIQLNGDSYGGIVKSKELTNKINALENLVNNLLITLKATVIPLAPTGTYPFAPLYAAYNNIAPITIPNDLSNNKVKHGS